jgi:DNA helicase-2/ATP-dependent DNA helicase PcrA
VSESTLGPDVVAAAPSPPILSSTAQLGDLMGIPFSDQQLTAITAPLEPFVVIAGAGSGKTTLMAARVVWLVTTGQIRPDQVLGLTFTNKAAAELRQRVRDFLTRAGHLPSPGEARTDGDLAEPTVSTYHAYAGRLLAEHGLRIGHEPDTLLLADATRFQLAERAVRQYDRPIRRLTTSTSHVVRYLLALDAQLSEHLVTPAQVRTWQAGEQPSWESAKQTKPVADVLATFHAREELLELVELYRHIKSGLGVMDFSDQMALAARLAERSPEVGEAERDVHRVVLLDEYQDTSIAQARLLRALYSGSPGEAALGHPVTAVGDPCQAIYGWRGASSGNIAAFPQHFPVTRGGVPTPSPRFPLSVNRRSLPAILDAANALALPLHAGVDGEPLQARPGAVGGRVRAAVLETFDDELAYLAREVPAAYEQTTAQWSDIAVLVRDNKTAAAVHDALVEADVPVEVVGLNGLLPMPEIAEVVATLEILHDVTANAALLHVLAGPRWRIGPRDLALLGARARRLSRGGEVEAHGLAAALEEAVAGVDPAEVVSLLEALDDPGTAGFSPEALERFEALSRELRQLQRSVGEPLLDLVRRVIDTIGIDVELAASNTRVAAARRDNLSTFLDAVASFAGVDADASLSGLLAYLAAEEEYGQGLALAVPTEADSVKLLTVHKAKGLEWEVVFVPGLTREVFPATRARPKWTSVAAELPWPLRGDADDLPDVGERSRQGLLSFTDHCREYDLIEETRLAYVAMTRARTQLVTSAYWWGPDQTRMRGPSVFMEPMLAWLRATGAEPDALVARPGDDAQNPSRHNLVAAAWPRDLEGAELERRRHVRDLVEAARLLGHEEASRQADDELLLVDQAEVLQWDLEIDRLVGEAERSRRAEVVVPLPASMSATTMVRLRNDPEGLARALARPMPREPSPSARYGTRFHAWVEAYVGQQQLLGPDELPGRADEEISGDEDLRELTDAFRAGPFGDREPHQVEAPFALVLDGQIVRGRIDAVYETADGFLVVDWKTNRQQTADPLQLAIYRVAWAELTGLPVERVRAAFCYVRSGEVVAFDELPGRAELERLLRAGDVSGR